MTKIARVTVISACREHGYHAAIVAVTRNQDLIYYDPLGYADLGGPDELLEMMRGVGLRGSPVHYGSDDLDETLQGFSKSDCCVAASLLVAEMLADCQDLDSIKRTVMPQGNSQSCTAPRQSERSTPRSSRASSTMNNLFEFGA